MQYPFSKRGQYGYPQPTQFHHSRDIQFWFDATYILVDIRQLQKINKWSAQQAGLFEVYIKDFDQMEPTGAYIYHHIPAEYDSQTIAQKYPTIFEWFHTFDLNILIIISIMVIV